MPETDKSLSEAICSGLISDLSTSTVFDAASVKAISDLIYKKGGMKKPATVLEALADQNKEEEHEDKKS